jgi:hypothetical protein
MEASPSLLGQVVLGMVHKVVVLIPPPTRAISSSFNERAPVRTNTLFWSSILFFPFIFFPFHLWAHATGPSLSKIRSNCGRAARYPELAFTNGGISVRAARFRISGASREGVYASFDKIDLFICKVASALANQYSILVVHSFPSSSLSSVEA